MNKMNKKCFLIPVAIILMVTMLMIPMASARLTTTWLNSVTNSNNVSNPQNLPGTSANGNYATFNPPNAMFIGKLSVTPGSGAVIAIYGHAEGGPVTITAYFGPTVNGAWTYAGQKTVAVSSSDAWHTLSGGSSPGGCQYIALVFSGSGTFYGDYIRVQY